MTSIPAGMGHPPPQVGGLITGLGRVRLSLSLRGG